MTAAIVPIAVAAYLGRDGDPGHAVAERIAAAVLVLAAVYIIFNESVANWQSVWLCALFAALALSLVRFRWPRAARS